MAAKCARSRTESFVLRLSTLNGWRVNSRKCCIVTDAELLRFGKDNRYMCSPYANMGKPPLEAFVIQLAGGQGGMEKAAS